MAPTKLNRAVLLMSSLVLAVGVVDSIASREWDFLAVFGMALALQLLLLARLSGRRPAVPIRRDLVGWLRDEAALAGETMEATADRAVSAYRAGFANTPEQTPAPHRREELHARTESEQDDGP